MHSNFDRWWLMLVALLFCSAIPSFAQQADMVMIGDETLGVSAELSGEETDLRLVTTPGAYVEGTFRNTGNRAANVVLLSPEGEVVRRLFKGNVTTQGSFRFVADRSQYRLGLRGGGAGTVTILRNLPQDAQEPHPDVIGMTTAQSPTLQALVGADDRAVNAFWQERARLGTPMVEADPSGDPTRRLVTFLWRGAQYNARLIGAPADDHIWLARLGDTDIWFASFRVGSDLRMSYQIAPDIPQVPGPSREKRMALLATLQQDPLNRASFGNDAKDRYARNSYFALPDAPVQPGVSNDTGGNPDLTEHMFKNPTTQQERRLWLHKTAGFDPADPNAVLLVMFDGRQYTSKVSVPAQLDRLHDAGQLPPMATVFIDSVGGQTRWEELSCNEAFLDQVAQDILPYAQAELGLTANGARTVIAGSSLGGLSSACLALRHPQAFGNFISMSGSYWWAPEHTTPDTRPYIVDLLEQSSPHDLRGFVSAGRYETSRFEDQFGIFEGSQALVEAMQQQGLAGTFWRAYEGGHDYAVWQGALTDGLLALFPTSP